MTHKKIILAISLSIIAGMKLFAQRADSTTTHPSFALETVEVVAYFHRQPTLGLTASVQSITSAQIAQQQTTTLLPALNTVAGIRMEERSPGSYRLAIRGSHLRSPFGVRNVKVYIDDFVLTDAGGNTYLNVIDPSSISSIHILKGPDGSLYGANSGGVIRFDPQGLDVKQNQGMVSMGGGSYGHFQENISIQQKINNCYSFSVDQSFNRSDGYRDHSNLHKNTIQTVHRWQYAENSELKFFGLYTNIDYRTPGGLTAEQMDENPRMSRPAGGSNPSAKAQHAGVRNQTLFGGIAHKTSITKKLNHTVSIFGGHTHFENPFITNYEFRKEDNLGLRTYFSLEERTHPAFRWQVQWGFEGQKGWYEIDNYDNDAGEATALQAKDDLKNTTASFFTRAMMNIHQRWTVEASLGYNLGGIDYRRHFPESDKAEGTIDFSGIWMPRFATSYKIREWLALRASISKGFSPPTLAEVRSSDNTLNKTLRPETGINYESGFRMETPNRRYIADMGFYHYTMNNGIVRQLRDNGAEYYVNAGEIRQRGVELSLWAYLVPTRTGRLLETLRYQSATTYSHFRFGEYHLGDNDYSGNKVTAVPEWTWGNTLLFSFGKRFGLTLSHYFSSAMPLNDANSVFSDSYHLVQMKATKLWALTSSLQMELFVGADNLLQEEYSLGNDINAFGNRYYNPAPRRNYYGGATLTFN